MSTGIATATALRTPEERVEGRAKVTGAARYAADIALPGALWAAFVGSPYPHARVVRVDASAALAMPGVRAVLAGKDTAPARFGRRIQDWPVLAHDRARFIGDRVAAVAADTRERAEAAARAIEVEYEELPAVLSPEAALAEGAPVLHPERASYAYFGEAPPVPHPNVQGHVLEEHGDVAGGFARAARVFEHTFSYGRNHQAYLEPRAATVWIDGDVVRVVSTNKAPFALRQQMARSLGIPEARIVVDSGYIGGDFGGKGLSIDEFALYFLARATGRPVRSIVPFTDDFQVTNPRHGGTISLRTAVDGDGRILAHEARVVLDGGAYAAGKPVTWLIPGDASLTLAGYRVPAARVEVLTVYTNTEPAGHVRAPGQPQNAFAAESHIDEIARALGIDPLELRLRNAIRPGDVDVHGHEWLDTLAPAVLETLRREAKWGEPYAASADGGPRVTAADRVGVSGRAVADRAGAAEVGAGTIAIGRGIGYCVRHVGRGKTSVVVQVASDGVVEVLTGAPDQGGGAHTMVQRVVAAELGVPPERVRVRRGTTAEVPFDPGVGGSRVTPVVGSAGVDGARKLREALGALVPAAVDGSGGGRSGAAASRPAETATAVAASVDKALRLAAREGLRVTGSADQGQGPRRYSVCAYAVTVAVDRDTGAVRVLDAVLVADVGTVINPVAHRGQLEGAFVFGLGQTLMEELRIEDGRVVTTNFDSYKIPTTMDVPPLRIVLLQDEPGPGPFGAKSVGELANAAVGPAIANAVRDAVGARVRSAPITAEKVWQELRT